MRALCRSMILLDTNVVSEIMLQAPHPGVVAIAARNGLAVATPCLSAGVAVVNPWLE